MIVRRFGDEAAAAEGTALRIAEAARAAISASGVFRIALAGGSTPQLSYRRLREHAIDWSHVEVFFGDERAVAPDDDASNYRMVAEALLAHVPVPAGHVHRIRGELGADEAARRYELELGDRPLDLVLLGMGADGHTASLFPGSVPDDEPRRVVATKGPPPHVARITLTLRALREAKCAVFLVTGSAKARCLAEVLAGARSGSSALPAARVRARSPVEWLVDEAAASELPPKEDGSR